jgi:hypothetical protein
MKWNQRCYFYKGAGIVYSAAEFSAYGDTLTPQWLKQSNLWLKNQPELKE